MKGLRKMAKNAWRPITLGAVGVSVVPAFGHALRHAVGDEFSEALEEFRERRHAR